MAERNAVKPRVCVGCNTEFRCTAKEIARRYNMCEGGLGTLTLLDCGLAPKVLEVLGK